MGARTITERVKFYKKNFMFLHDKGKSISEIAEECNISRGHAYMLLQEIADENGVSREELLKIKNRKQTQSVNSSQGVKVLVDGNELKKNFEELASDIDCIVEKIDQMILL